jgi:hypothetical protein
MKTIGVAVLSLVAALLRCANAGDFPSGGVVDVTRPIMVDLPSLAPVEANYEFAPFALDMNPPMSHALGLLSFGSNGPVRLLLDAWLPRGAGADSPFESALALNLKYGPRRGGNVFSPAKMAAIASHASTVPGPFVRSIEVNYPGASANVKEKIVAKLRIRVGRRYSQRVAEEDTRDLSKTEGIKRVRIFGVPFADGVQVIVAMQPKEGPDFNIGYQF